MGLTIEGIDNNTLHQLARMALDVNRISPKLSEQLVSVITSNRIADTPSTAPSAFACAHAVAEARFPASLATQDLALKNSNHHVNKGDSEPKLLQAGPHEAHTVRPPYLQTLT